ncbi:MAG: OsmC family protein [bacterium]
MSNQMKISFPGGAGVDAEFKGFTIRTDRAIKQGGLGEQPTPFDLFLFSLGTCAGYYVLQFLETRNISKDGCYLTMDADWDQERKRLNSVKILIKLPENFPEKYRKAVIAAAETCTVKRTMLDPPEFLIETV